MHGHGMWDDGTLINPTPFQNWAVGRFENLNGVGQVVIQIPLKEKVLSVIWGRKIAQMDPPELGTDGPVTYNA